MALGLDPEISAALDARLGNGRRGAADRPPSGGDVTAVRASLDPVLRALAAEPPVPPGIEVTRHAATSADGTQVPMRLYRSPGTPETGLVVYFHGGGMVAGDLDIYDPVMRRYVGAGGIPMLAVDYRLAPEHPYPAGVEDGYAAIVWAAKKAGELGSDPTRIAVAGDGGGAAIAAGAVLLGRDRGGPTLAGQLLVYPMLDDRTVTPDPLLGRGALWRYEDNRAAWAAVLDRPVDAEPAHAPAYAAPARASDVAGLPPTYLEVGSLDIVRDEGLTFGARLARVGIPVEMHMHAGAPHAFDLLAPDAAVTQRATADRLRFLESVAG
ncbi:alpha/beta hydrolase [Cryptosporangium aurantiacum]|uniref:Acetyl esterase/lipase n=1 Tax=Cryptosporangium aurantiacum TaxID=134849 RepID=A0A1M7RLS6_9ACTN|nr:alpha/beta hydrolase fold domain-containing protein [Cryptosporangium aurantiacum]SHN47131.1 Acetyl esterase/lipase [Cryptosporangium aurantiacum]